MSKTNKGFANNILQNPRREYNLLQGYSSQETGNWSHNVLEANNER